MVYPSDWPKIAYEFKQQGKTRKQIIKHLIKNNPEFKDLTEKVVSGLIYRYKRDLGKPKKDRSEVCEKIQAYSAMNVRFTDVRD